MSATVSVPAEPAGHVAPGDRRDSRRWWVLAVLSLVVLVATLDNTVLSVAVPSLARDLRLSSSGVQWVLDTYSLVFAGLLVTAGVLSDRYGRRRGFLLGLAVFGAGSLAASLADGGAQLIAARGLMGVGGAFLMPGTLSLLTHTFDEQERRTAFGVWSGVSALGLVVGPVLGGLLVQRFGWNAVFVINLPIVAVALVAGRLLIRESADPAAPRPDLPGTVLSTLATGSTVWAVIEVPQSGWTSPRVLTGAGLGVLAAVALAGWLRRAASPMIDPALLRNRRFLGAAALGTLFTFGLGGSLFLLTQYLQFVLGLDALAAGLRTAPMALAVLVTAPLAGVVAARIGDARTVAVGLALGACGFGIVGAAALAAPASTVPGYGPVLAGLLVLGAGGGLVMAPINTCVMSALPSDRAGVASAVTDTAQELGTALGVAVLGSVLAAGYRSAMPAGTPSAFVASPADALRELGRAGAVLRAAVRSGLETGIGAGLLTGALLLGLAAASAPLLLGRLGGEGTAAGPQPRSAGAVDA